MTGGNSNEREAGWVVFAGLNGRAEHRDTARGVGRGVRVRGWRIVGEFEDRGISGAKGREKRPGFDRLLKAATTHKIDVVAAWSVDRLGRSLQDLVGFLGKLSAVGCDLYLERQAVDTTTPAGRALFQMLGVSPSSSARSFKSG